MKGKRSFALPRLDGIAPWAILCLLLFFGLAASVIDLLHLPVSQARYANDHGLSFVINPETGDVFINSSDASGEQKVAEFEVGEANTAADAVANAPAEKDAAVTGAPELRTTPLLTPMEMPSRTKESLLAAPAPEVTETVGGVSLPKMSEAGGKASQLYAHPFKRKLGQVPVAFLVMDAGIDPQATSLLMALPPEVSVAYSPYTKPDASYSEHLRTLGHEVWVMLPTMSARYPADDPGPRGLISKLPAEELARRVREALGVVQGLVGVVLPPDESLSQHKESAEAVVKEATSRGLVAIATHPTHGLDQLTGDKALIEQSIRRADLVLDPEPDEKLIQTKLDSIPASAQEKSEYLVVLHATPLTLKLLGNWLKKNPLHEPVVLAPASALFSPKPTEESEKPPEPEKKSSGHH